MTANTITVKKPQSQVESIRENGVALYVTDHTGKEWFLGKVAHPRYLPIEVEGLIIRAYNLGRWHAVAEAKAAVDAMEKRNEYVEWNDPEDIFYRRIRSQKAA